MTTLHRLRNIGISAHIDSGKTTLTERMLFYCGRIHDMHEVHDKTHGATMDSDPIERKRGITIASAATTVHWGNHTINVIDTPGHVDFTVEVERSLRVLDGAVLVLCSVGGVQSQSLTVDRQMRRYGVPRIAVINKMDRVGANPQSVIEQMRERLNCNPILIQIPVGSESNFTGVVDLITMQAVYFDGHLGSQIRREAIPENLLGDAEAARAEMLESLALVDETLLNEIAAGNDPHVDQIRAAIRIATLTHQATPVLLCTAFKNKGVQLVLDAVTEFLPSPNERRVMAEDDVELHCDANQPAVAMAFKTVVEKFGQLTYLRVYQGCLRKGQSYRNARTGKLVRFGRLVRLHANDREEIESAQAGDIVGVIGVDCASGDTFTDPELRLALENIHVAKPVMQLAIAPRKRDDAKKLSKALERFRREDPTFQVFTDQATSETLIAGMGQLHLDVYTERIETDYDCPCVVGHPRVNYKERPTQSVAFDQRLKKMTGGPGMFAHIIGRLEVLPEESDVEFEFESQISGGRIGSRFIQAARDGFAEALVHGPLGKHPVVGVKVVLTDGGQHDTESSELSFRQCARETMQRILLPQAKVVLLEPVMLATIDVPDEYQGSVTGYVARKRGTVTRLDQERGDCEITAEVPLAEMFEFANDIRSMTQGKGTFAMQPLNYREAPAAVQANVLARQAELASQ